MATERKKFFEWKDVIAVGKVFPNESRDTDIFVIEIMTKKLSFNECKGVLSPLLAISSKVFIQCGDEDLVQSLNTVMPILTSLKEVYELGYDPGYEQEDRVSAIGDALAPKVCFINSNDKVIKMA